MQHQDNKVIQQATGTDDCLSAKELVNRHLQNKDHEISDEDLQKIALDCDEPKVESSQIVTTPDATSTALNASNSIEDTSEDNDEKKEEKDILVTPLDVLG